MADRGRVAGCDGLALERVDACGPATGRRGRLDLESRPVLERDEVHVWRVAHGSATRLPDLTRTLSADERARAACFRFERDRDRFVAARGMLRTILGLYLDREPARLRFCSGANGKPALAPEDDGDRLCFNLAHADDLALYAVARGREVGVDLERIRVDLDIEAMAAVTCAPRERAALAALSPEHRPEAFVALWVCKEAYAKAVGLGLSLSPERIEVTPGPEPRVTILVDGAPPPGRWHARTLSAGPDNAAALVVAGDEPRVVLKCWPDAGSGAGP